ncbi:MAG: hypothetical protein WDW38_007965 [Sanguina aurantia]
MNSIAYGEVMKKAARDYAKEYLAGGESTASTTTAALNMADFLGDSELEQLHSDRIAQLQEQAEKRTQLAQKGHGIYSEISEGEFLEIVTKSRAVVCHFFHREFERCKIIDKHMHHLARKYFDTRFIKLSAPDTPFFTVKLGIKTLPFIMSFNAGVAVDKIVGFEPLGGKDDFPTSIIENILLACGVVVPPKVDEDEVDRTDAPSKNIRRSIHYNQTASDEDSEFDDA